MRKVEILKNNEVIKNCTRDRYDNVRNLSCNIIVTGVNNSDEFDCNIFASKAPCNGARIIFEVQSKSRHSIRGYIYTRNSDS